MYAVHMACAKDNWIRYFMALTVDNATTNDKLKLMCENEAAIDSVLYFKECSFVKKDCNLLKVVSFFSNPISIWTYTSRSVCICVCIYIDQHRRNFNRITQYKAVVKLKNLFSSYRERLGLIYMLKYSWSVKWSLFACRTVVWTQQF